MKLTDGLTDLVMRMLYFQCRIGGEEVMIDVCKNCGCTEAQAIADAKTLGLTQEFQNGVYSCCQIADWAQEQWLAWVEATQQDIDRAAEPTKQSGHHTAHGACDGVDLQAVLVPVRFRKPVPWFKSPDRWS